MKSKPELKERAKELASYLKGQGITYRKRYLHTGVRVQRVKFWKLTDQKDSVEQCIKRFERLGLKVKKTEEPWIGTSIAIYFTDKNIVKKLKLPKKVKKKVSQFEEKINKLTEDWADSCHIRIDTYGKGVRYHFREGILKGIELCSELLVTND